MPETQLTDWRGNTIEVGDVILYSVKHSTEVEVNEAVVAGFGERITWREEPETTILVDWIRSSEGEYSQKWRKVRRVTIFNTGSVTLLAKHNANV